MINLLLGALGCRIQIVSSLGKPIHDLASGLTVYAFPRLDIPYHPTLAHLIGAYFSIEPGDGVMVVFSAN